MIDGLIREIIVNLQTENASWLSEIRGVGYAYTSEIEGKRQIRITDFENEIGITDIRVNSGYLRFRNDNNFQSQELPRIVSCARVFRYTYQFRLVVACITSTPENLAFLLATQLNSMSFDKPTTQITVTAGGSNSYNVALNEGSEQINAEYRVVYVDFNLVFNHKCEPIPVTMDCPNCTSTLDLGCLQHCDTLTVHADIAYSGTATLHTTFNGNMVVQTFEVTSGEDLEVPMSGLNENYEYVIQFRDEDGELIPIFDADHGGQGHGHDGDDHGGHEYDCIKITLKP